MTKSSFSTTTLTRRKTGPFLVRAAFTSSAASLASRTVPTSAIPQPLAISARSAPAPDSVGPLLRGLVCEAWLPVSPNFSLSSTTIARFSGCCVATVASEPRTHHQVGVARDHQHPLGGLRQGEARAHADRCAHARPTAAC